MKKILLLRTLARFMVLGGALLLGACAKVNDAGRWLVSVAYGVSESDALAFLKAPPGKKLVVGADGALALQ
ncbi:hypothetical protein [Rhodoferax sp. GW822-FHT02A01]|uniref:hypothetical protein n=1 Tax=Rhodoferax sp. GW822-FHT02A01 TaxID=3141537 RepID=UPI00315C7088